MNPLDFFASGGLRIVIGLGTGGRTPDKFTTATGTGSSHGLVTQFKK